MLNYRTIIYSGTLLTGLTGLVYQVTWQKYLSFIVGSEARSVALVVATFLAGLAAGYRYWGTLSERHPTRRELLRIYGFIEIGIGLYAALFPFYLGLVRLLSHHGPSSLLTDILATMSTLLAPTFLMGATIPLLVSVVPESSEEVHLCHAKIYGINTLGACVGAFGASFFLIPRLGLSGSLYLAAAINLVVGTTFVLNRLEHATTEKEPLETIPSRFDARSVYLYTFITGTITLSLEVLLVRVLNLTVGAGPHNFAMIIGIFILGLAIGSLVLTTRLLSVTYLFRAILFLIGYLMVLYYSIPYWPYWLNNVRVSLATIPTNYEFHLILITGFLAVALLPFLIPLGSMLPLVYSFLPKDLEDYGKKCGWLYFYNTLGTALGSVLLSYLLLYFVGLDQVFKIDVALLALLALYLFHREKRWLPAGILLLVTVGFLAGPAWDRSSHYVGLFRFAELKPFNFQGIFLKPQMAPEVAFFEDGPDTTVTVVNYLRQSPPGESDARPLSEVSHSLVINGKSDGDTILDYSTITLAALLPYLHAPQRADLDAAVIGMGTGITAGLLARGEDVGRLTLVEISSTLVKSAPEFDADNFGLRANPKVEIIDTDGFKYFTRLRDKLDIVVSATSPPWVVGVENLFTPEFYALARDSLNDDGVFMQWFPLYSMEPLLFRTILKNLGDVFPHLRLYRISAVEMGILASRSPLRVEPDTTRFDEPTVAAARERLYLEDPAQLELIRLYGDRELRFLLESGGFMKHTLDRPQLAYASDRIRFLNPDVDWDAFIDPRLFRLTGYTDARGRAFADMSRRWPDGLPGNRLKGTRLFSDLFNDLRQTLLIFEGRAAKTTLAGRVAAYDRLRQGGVLPIDPEFLAQATARLIESNPPADRDTREIVERIVLTYVKDGMWEEARRDLLLMKQAGVIGEDFLNRIMSSVEGSRRGWMAFVTRYRSG